MAYASSYEQACTACAPPFQDLGPHPARGLVHHVLVRPALEPPTPEGGERHEEHDLEYERGPLTLRHDRGDEQEKVESSVSR
mgnify:CR=1 FL=1